MNCFVIMPFSPEFDDVYAVIKSTTEKSISTGRCFRLDETRPAGRITDRLLSELRSATLCIADLTDTKPNVMWETGFAMALNIPTILITQNLSSLPFDIKDMQSIPYSRDRLSATLAGPLGRSIVDTIATSTSKHNANLTIGPSADDFGALLSEVAQLKQMISESVGMWKDHPPPNPASPSTVQQLVGKWINQESGSHSYSRLINGSLVTPYCYGGNESLTGVYHDWRQIGEYWFGRYQWVTTNLNGFTFLKQETLGQLTGAWWDASEEKNGVVSPPKNAGVASTWVKQPNTPTPSWAQHFFDLVEAKGLPAALRVAGKLGRIHR